MKIRLISALIFVLLFSDVCYAQASMVLKNGEGQTVGWLQSIDVRESVNYYQYLTPTGLILTLNRRLWVVSDSLYSASKLVYTLPDCEGSPYALYSAPSDFERMGEVYPLANNAGASVFVALPFGASGGNDYEIVSEKSEWGECTNLPETYVSSTVFVNEVDPASLGLSRIGIVSFWGVQSGQHFLERPNLISCDGFESCPQQ